MPTSSRSLQKTSTTHSSPKSIRAHSCALAVQGATVLHNPSFGECTQEGTVRVPANTWRLCCDKVTDVGSGAGSHIPLSSQGYHRRVVGMKTRPGERNHVKFEFVVSSLTLACLSHRARWAVPLSAFNRKRGCSRRVGIKKAEYLVGTLIVQ